MPESRKPPDQKRMNPIERFLEWLGRWDSSTSSTDTQQWASKQQIMHKIRQTRSEDAPRNNR